MAIPQASAVRSRFAPSVPELLFVAIVLWLIAFTVTGDATGMGLLRDSQTGYHIRVGEYVLEHRAVPSTDFLSFTRANEPFYAWEWLAGVGSAVLYRIGGLQAIAVLSALLLGLTVLVMLRHAAWRGANVLVAVFLIHLAIGASSIHYLARPHIFTLLFLAIALWLLDSDRQQETHRIWWLLPLTAVWANLHGGFFGLLVSLGILAAGSAIEWWFDRSASTLRRTIRWAGLTVACFAASLVNPYGIYEHIHLVQFMRETWYLRLTEEYQPPNFFSGAGSYYAILLVAGIAVAARLIQRRQFGWALLTLAWAYASSRSMRHIPIYAMVVLPHLAEEAMIWWNRWVEGKSARTLAGTLEKIAADYQESMNRSSAFGWIAAAVLLVLPLGLPGDFPAAVYPVAMVNHHDKEIAKSRVFTTDAWGHYLTYRYPVPYGIYIDGRCDFFGERFTQEYLDAVNGEAGWDRTLDRYKVEMVLVPPEMAITARLRGDRGWKLVEETPAAVLFARAS